jgi:hypothetical protein
MPRDRVGAGDSEWGAQLKLGESRPPRLPACELIPHERYGDDLTGFPDFLSRVIGQHHVTGDLSEGRRDRLDGRVKSLFQGDLNRLDRDHPSRDLQSALLLSFEGWDKSQEGNGGDESYALEPSGADGGRRLWERRVPPGEWKRLAHDDLAFLAEGRYTPKSWYTRLITGH